MRPAQQPKSDAAPRAVAKLSTPRATTILHRERLSQRIEAALASGVCWLAAPAGYGKTTATVDYLSATGTPHVWYRVDEGDQDVARFFHYLALSLGKAASAMPVFGAEYAEQPAAFARRFFRAYFAQLAPDTVLVLDDVHDADTLEFRRILAVLFRELPYGIRCICLSRTLPQQELSDLAVRGQVSVIDRAVLEFSDDEAQQMVRLRREQNGEPFDVEAAHGWAVGLVLLAEQGPRAIEQPLPGQDGLFDVLGRQFFQNLPDADQQTLLKLSLLPDLSVSLADALVGSRDAGRLLDWLYQRQMLVTRAETQRDLFQLHDLLRDFLHARFLQRLSPDEQVAVKRQAARILHDAGRDDEAIPLALDAEDWPLARAMIAARADALLAEGRRATVIDWCSRLPDSERDAWLCYWLGVAHIPDDAASERWLARAWAGFEADGDLRGQALTVARAVLVKTDSWRTYDGLSIWTRRALALIETGLPTLAPEEDLLVRIGLVRAMTFADEYYRSTPATEALTSQLLDRLANQTAGDPSGLRLLASESLIELSVSTMRAELFTKAVDSVADDLKKGDILPWIRGAWLVAFGAKSGRYFPYARRGFAYPSAEAALRAAIAIGEEEGLSSIEFGAIYHLQMQMKFASDFGELEALISRLAEIADSRFTTQVAVVADCLATLHARQGNFAEAYRDCDRFMAAIEAANEPMLERWPHYITKFQVLLLDRKADEAKVLLANLLPRLEGGATIRTNVCILAADALASRWSGDGRYREYLAAFFAALKDARWPMVLLNAPELLAELVSDALAHRIEPEFCRQLVRDRNLSAPPTRPAAWPWPLKVHVLGGFRIERDGAPLDLGSKPPTRALDILRILAITKDHTASLETVQDWLWPDLDGDQAKAACEQALHRLRKLLGQGDLLIQREGKLRLPADKVWVDLADWEARAARAEHDEAEKLLAGFPGPLLMHERSAGWTVPAAERVERGLVSLAIKAGRLREAGSERHAARALYSRALEFYPDSDELITALNDAG